MVTRLTVAVVFFALVGVTPLRAQAPAAGDKADALSEAVRKGDAAAVKTLLDEGVDVNTKFRYNREPLSFAADRGHVDVVRLLLGRGADVNAKDTFYNATALTWAVNPAMDRKPQHTDVVRLLLQHGAQGKDGALGGAVAAGDAPMVKAILEIGGLGANAMSDALEAATKAKHPEIAALLEAAGARPHVELKLDAAQLARYVGTYTASGPTSASLVVSTADGRLVATLGGQKLTLVARDPVTFGVVEQPITTVTFKMDADKAATITLSAMGNSISFTRAGEK